ncbi:hypothetical protein ABID19_006911 [Mesorhizobium robiniae]|uniref:Restriction endonuclease type IV Mrr domain-containing protein n=1 Tax=Mesorhizobium robiniae TaxID=559315 RepID=A0ABV2GZX9_9HYPH|nr:type IV toxin-antitoxin system AbiEi family antitoxin [Mesorhizobium sp. ZC-5]MCV3244109.1 type IV toxin-antitoxin system AbiEi family antitoxin [Mesorhizobium sp. ZC-5]
MCYFQQMLKAPSSLKEVEEQAEQALTRLLASIPPIKIDRIEASPSGGPDRGIDLIAHIRAFGARHVLLCEVKSTGQPRHARDAITQLHRAAAGLSEKHAVPVFIAPFLMPQTRDICTEAGVSFLDFEGNCRLAFDGVFVERVVPTKPATERREVKSIFKPKSAQVLRTMLRNPGHFWRVTELAERAQVSLGHVSNMRTALIAREWAKIGEDGISLTEPDNLLDAWRDVYEPPAGRRMGFYTTLHGKAFDEVIRRNGEPDPSLSQMALASFSAAQWLAPYARTGTHFFYASANGLERARTALNLSSAARGENVVVTVLKDTGPLLDTIEPSPGISTTSPVQTYLDLWVAGERGREAAEYLRKEKLKWHV